MLFRSAGNPMSAANEEHLYRCLAVLRRADRGGSAFNRAALFRANRGAVAPFDLLADRRYDIALWRSASAGCAEWSRPLRPRNGPGDYRPLQGR